MSRRAVRVGRVTSQAHTDAQAAAARAGDEAAFAGLVEHHRRELQVHCYRMLGSVEEAEDMVQETLLRAWRPPRRRAVLIMRDVLGWPARQVAEHLGVSEASVTSSLHRARTTLRERLPDRTEDWSTNTGLTAAERAVVDRYMTAIERADLDAIADLVADDVRAAMPPWTLWLTGRTALLAMLTASWDTNSPDYVGELRMVPIRANGQPAGAGYVRRPGDDTYRAFSIGILQIDNGRITEMTSFHDPALFATFRLPATLSAGRP